MNSYLLVGVYPLPNNLNLYYDCQHLFIYCCYNLISIYSLLEKTLTVYTVLIKKYDICAMIQIGTIFDILIKGFAIGVVVSAPLGPVGVLCIQRTLNKGRWYGFITGLGASVSDIAYALLTGYGMSFIFDYIDKNMFYLQLLCSIMLLLFVIYTFRSNPVQIGSAHV